MGSDLPLNKNLSRGSLASGGKVPVHLSSPQPTVILAPLTSQAVLCPLGGCIYSRKPAADKTARRKRGLWNWVSTRRLGLPLGVKWQRLRGPSLQGPQDSWGLAHRGSLCPAFPGAVEPAQMHFPVDADRCCASIFYTRASAWRGR